jgi:hypothetical protein
MCLRVITLVKSDLHDPAAHCCHPDNSAPCPERHRDRYDARRRRPDILAGKGEVAVTVALNKVERLLRPVRLYLFGMLDRALDAFVAE